jgi:ribonuclease VapC
MFIDASALVAILNKEEDADILLTLVKDRSDAIYFSDIVLFEASHAVARLKAATDNTSLKVRPELLTEACVEILAFFRQLGARYVPVDTDIGAAAINASRTYGKVVGHRAALNLGDCYSYACAKFLQVPLLYKGQDFAATDIA